MRARLVVLLLLVALLAGCASKEGDGTTAPGTGPGGASGTAGSSGSSGGANGTKDTVHPKPVDISDSIDLSNGASGRTWTFDAGYAVAADSKIHVVIRATNGQPVRVENGYCLKVAIDDGAGFKSSQTFGTSCGGGGGIAISPEVTGGGETVLYDIAATRIVAGHYELTFDSQPALGTLDVSVAIHY